MRPSVLTLVVVVVAAIAAACGDSDRAQPAHSTEAATAAGPPPLRVRYTAIVSARTARARFPGVALSGAVADGRGGWFVTGAFGLARMRADGRFDKSWGTTESRKPYGCELAKAGRRLFLAQLDGRIAAFAARSGARLWVSDRFVPRGRLCFDDAQGIGYLAASGKRVYAAGCFAHVGGVRRLGLAAVDARTGHLLDSWRSANLGRCVFGLALSGPRLFVSQGGGGLVALDPATGRFLPWHTREKNPWYEDPGVVGDVDNIFVTHGLVITSGFDSSGAITSERTGRPHPLWGRVGGIAFGAKGDILYLGGDLRHGVGQVGSEPNHNLIAFDLKRQRVTNWRPSLDNFVSVGAIVPSGQNVLVLGAFMNTVG